MKILVEKITFDIPDGLIFKVLATIIGPLVGLLLMHMHGFF